jgi:2-polyprenyl-3-methyl-5-hydroxy-6-metoxy-1,4-benzoquinol methylase
MRAADSVVQDLKEYMGTNYNPPADAYQASADEFNKMRPLSKEGLANYYKDSDTYIYDLVQWHQTGIRKGITTYIFKTMHHAKIRSAIDVGAGICTDAIDLASAEIEMSVCDLPTKYFAFGLWRIKKHGLEDKIKVVDYDSLFDNKYECMIFTTVLEHIPDLLQEDGFLTKVANATNKIVEISVFDKDKIHPYRNDYTRKEVYEKLGKLGFHVAYQSTVYAPKLWVKK